MQDILVEVQRQAGTVMWNLLSFQLAACLDQMMPASPAFILVYCWPATRLLRELQNSVTTLINSLRATMTVPPDLEEAMRMVPRSAFLPHSQAAEAWLPKPVMAAGGPPIVLGPPQAEMLALQVGGALLHCQLWHVHVAACQCSAMDSMSASAAF